MGGIISSEADLADNAALKKFTGLETISDNDPFWNNLLSFNLKIDEKENEVVRSFDEATIELLSSLMFNTQRTGNFSSLIRVFLRRASELKISEQCENKIFLWQTTNSLIILRYIFKFLTERMNESEFVKVFDWAPPTSAESDSDDSDDEETGDNAIVKSSTCEEFMVVLLNILRELPVNDITMGIHIETVKCIITILSAQLYREDCSHTSLIFGYFQNGSCSPLSADLCKTLLNNYLHHNNEYIIPKPKEPESLVIGLASSFWSMVQVAAGIEEVPGKTDDLSLTLGGVSLLLLLNLSCHNTEGLNPFKDILSVFQNSQEVSTLLTGIANFKIPYSALYERLCATASQEPSMLLLYLLLHRNTGFRNFVLSRINLENLVVPVLRILHEGVSAPMTNSHHMYLALIVILIFSEDDFFCKIIHETMVKDVDWVESDRPLREISLGGLTALIFIRTIQKNALKMRDRYLHTNCLAALANMSSCFKNLSPVVCQKLITLIEVLSKRHAKMVEHMRTSSELDVVEGQPPNFHEDITALEEGIRTLLEIINSTLTSSLRHNPHLVYTLLYHRTLFDSYQHHPMFQDLLGNIAAVISHFSSKVVHVKAGDGAGLMEVIEKEVLVWPTDRLAKFPELKFRYVEDDNTVDFFVPYVWKLSVDYSFIHFDRTRIKMFNAS
ncbi:unnamed protein product [Auanema sp. JU1783]|nr:unnamed protein product [Auanema sp. JU1783]